MPSLGPEILSLSEDELNALPFGIIRLDKHGKILFCNKAQASLSRRDVEVVVGRDFFRDVAPCAAVKKFQGRFNEFAAGSGSAIESFTFAFRFSWGSRLVMLTFVRAATVEQGVYIVVALALVDPLMARDTTSSIAGHAAIGVRQ